MTATTRPLEDIINVALYPLAADDDSARQRLIEKHRLELQTKLYCTLPNFVAQPALEAMAAEAKQLRKIAYHNNSRRNCYLHQQQDPSLEAGHARNLRDRSSTRMIAYDQISETSVLKAFYHHDAVDDSAG